MFLELMYMFVDVNSNALAQASDFQIIHMFMYS